MTSMPDSITPANLAPGYPAYLGYVDGNWPTANEVAKAHPGAHVVRLTVLGSTLDADGVDVEKGDLAAVGGALWVHRKLAAQPQSRPVVYADLATPGYSMGEVIAELLQLGVTRSQYRVLTAHYDGQHVCSPGRGCQDKDGRVIAFTADGTQWTKSFPGAGGTQVDMSLLDDDFFGSPAPAGAPAWQEAAVKALPLVTQGSSDVQAVRTVQGLLCARGHAVTVDGAFGPATLTALEDFQRMRGLSADGKAALLPGLRCSAYERR